MDQTKKENNRAGVFTLDGIRCHHVDSQAPALSSYKSRSGIIYKVINLINGKIYIGKSVNSFKKRIGQHKAVYQNLKNKKGDTVFYKALRKYGWESFKWENIDCSIIPDFLAELEKKYIIEFNCKVPNGYNLTDGGEGIPGCSRSEETKRKIGDKHRGKIMSAESRGKMSEAHRVENLSEETRANISRARIGKKHSEKTKRKMSLSHAGIQPSKLAILRSAMIRKGRHLSDAHKKKLSIAHIGKCCGKNHYHFGNNMSDKTKKKISLSKKNIPWTQARRDAENRRRECLNY